MARSPLSDSLAKRDHLYSEKVTDEERNECADSFLEDGRYGEALEYLEITKDAARLARVEEVALEGGDTFLLLRLERIRGEDLPSDAWGRVADRALRLEKYYDAIRAFERAGDEERAERIREEHTDGFRPWRTSPG
jgi:hypothetical protein